MPLVAADDLRTDFRIPVDILLNKYIRGCPHVVRASNLSRRGMHLHRVFEPVNSQSSIGLQFQLPGSARVITCAGRIIHDEHSPSGQGVEFTNVDPNHQTMIDNFILERLPWP